MNNQQFKFPITERKVLVHNGITDFIDLENKQTYLTGGYKAIIRTDTNQLISIIRSSYKIVPNAVLIDQLLDALSGLDQPFVIDPSHSFYESNRFRLQITFKD